MNDEFVVAAVLADQRGQGGGSEKLFLKQLRDVSNPFARSERKFKKLFRFSRRMALDVVDILCAGDQLQAGTIPAHLKVLSALHFFAHGSYQTAVGELNILALSQPTISRALADVTEAIIEKLTPQWIKFPVSSQEKERVKNEFIEMFGMPNTLGAVDGTHIGIQKPPITHPTAPGSLFYNRKGFYSVNCQVVCDAKGIITSVNPNFPGSTHDAAIWRSSNVHRHLESAYVEEQPMEWLLGDKGYPLLPWLMTPHPEPIQGSAEERYNKCHAQARGVIEMCFGVLKNKLRCLHRHRILHYGPEKAAKIIVSCCTIYNMLKWAETNETEDDSESDDEDADEELSSGDEVLGSVDDEQGADDEDGHPEELEDLSSFLNVARERRAFLIRTHFSY